MQNLIIGIIILLLLISLFEKNISYFVDSPMDIYKDIAAGTAQVNAMSDFLQEDEKSMKTGSPIFTGKGITRDIHVQYPFSCEPRLRGENESDFGCDVTVPESSLMMEAEGPVSGFTQKDLYDYTKPVNFDYSSQRTNELFNS